MAANSALMAINPSKISKKKPYPASIDKVFIHVWSSASMPYDVKASIFVDSLLIPLNFLPKPMSSDNSASDLLNSVTIIYFRLKITIIGSIIKTFILSGSILIYFNINAWLNLMFLPHFFDVNYFTIGEKRFGISHRSYSRSMYICIKNTLCHIYLKLVLEIIP